MHGSSVVVRSVGSLVSLVGPWFLWLPVRAFVQRLLANSLAGLVHEAAGCRTPRGLYLCRGPDGGVRIQETSQGPLLIH